MSYRKVITRLAVVAAVVAGGLTVAAPAQASYYKLATSDSDPVVGESVAVNVGTDLDISPSGYYIEIRDYSGVFLTCTSLPCRFTTSRSSATEEYFEADFIRWSDGFLEYLPSTFVTWHDPVTTCLPVPSPGQVCVTTLAKAAQAYVYTGLVVGAGLKVAGYLDQYTLTAVATVTIVCPVLITNGTTETNPCKIAGGHFVSRMAALIDAQSSGNNDPVTPLVGVDICNASLKVLVNGLGVNSAPILAVC